MKTLNRFLIVMWVSLCSCAAEWLPLWPGEAPAGAKPAVLTEHVKEGGRMTDIAVPKYEVHLPGASKRTDAAVVILPGGGYTILAMGHEGRDYAQWLAARGIVAVIAMSSPRAGTASASRARAIPRAGLTCSKTGCKRASSPMSLRRAVESAWCLHGGTRI